MLSRAIEEQFVRLLALHEQGILGPQELARPLAQLICPDNVIEVIQRLPPALAAVLRDGLGAEARDAAAVDHLHPADSPFSWAFGVRYQLAVAEALLSFVQDRTQPILTAVCLPSFQPEWAVCLLGSEQHGYSLLMREAQTQIYRPELGTDALVKEAQAALVSELARGVRDAWEKMLRRTRQPQSKRFGVDGVNYHFVCGTMAGHTWSPQADTPPGYLVALTHALRDLALADEPRREQALARVRDRLAWFCALPERV